MTVKDGGLRRGKVARRQRVRNLATVAIRRTPQALLASGLLFLAACAHAPPRPLPLPALTLAPATVTIDPVAMPVTAPAPPAVPPPDALPPAAASEATE